MFMFNVIIKIWEFHNIDWLISSYSANSIAKKIIWMNILGCLISICQLLLYASIITYDIRCYASTTHTSRRICKQIPIFIMRWNSIPNFYVESLRRLCRPSVMISSAKKSIVNLFTSFLSMTLQIKHDQQSTVLLIDGLILIKKW